METQKTCTKCKIAKPFSEFNCNSRQEDGYNYTCRLCIKAHYQATKEACAARAKAYREAHAENLKIRRRERYDPVLNALRGKQYHEKNRERALAQNKLYYQENKEKCLAQHKAYRTANAEKIRTAFRNLVTDVFVVALRRSYKRTTSTPFLWEAQIQSTTFRFFVFTAMPVKEREP